MAVKRGDLDSYRCPSGAVAVVRRGDWSPGARAARGSGLEDLTPVARRFAERHELIMCSRVDGWVEYSVGDQHLEVNLLEVRSTAVLSDRVESWLQKLAAAEWREQELSR